MANLFNWKNSAGEDITPQAFWAGIVENLNGPFSFEQWTNSDYQLVGTNAVTFDITPMGDGPSGYYENKDDDVPNVEFDKFDAASSYKKADMLKLDSVTRFLTEKDAFTLTANYLALNGTNDARYDLIRTKKQAEWGLQLKLQAENMNLEMFNNFVPEASEGKKTFRRYGFKNEWETNPSAYPIRKSPVKLDFDTTDKLAVLTLGQRVADQIWTDVQSLQNTEDPWTQQIPLEKIVVIVGMQLGKILRLGLNATNSNVLVESNIVKDDKSMPIMRLNNIIEVYESSYLGSPKNGTQDINYILKTPESTGFLLKPESGLINNPIGATLDYTWGVAYQMVSWVFLPNHILINDLKPIGIASEAEQKVKAAKLVADKNAEEAKINAKVEAAVNATLAAMFVEEKKAK